VAKKFKFTLETLKKYRAQRLLLAKKDLALINARFNDLMLRIEVCNTEAKLALDDALTVGKRAMDFLLGASLHESARLAKKNLSGELELVQKELDRHQEWVTHLSRELKAVEKLEERQRERYNKEIVTKEKQNMDAWVAERWGHSPMSRIQK